MGDGKWKGPCRDKKNYSGHLAFSPLNCDESLGKNLEL